MKDLMQTIFNLRFPKGLYYDVEIWEDETVREGFGMMAGSFSFSKGLVENEDRISFYDKLTKFLKGEKQNEL